MVVSTMVNFTSGSKVGIFIMAESTTSPTMLTGRTRKE